MGLSQTLEERARKTHSPQKHCPWGWSARRLSSWGYDGGIVVPKATAGRRGHIPPEHLPTSLAWKTLIH